jgi:hypothetical protein
MVDITRDNTTEFKVHEFMVDASDLGLPPGTWPKTLTTDLGNKQPFIRVHVDAVRGRYRQEFGCIELMIWND